MRVLILVDEATIPYMRHAQAPIAPYSHDKNLFQFAHESLRKGFDVFFSAVQQDALSRAYLKVLNVYPDWHIESQNYAYADVAPDIIVSVFPESLNIRSIFPHPKIVAIHAAIHFIESPERFSAQYVYDLITSIRYNVDFIVTQNARMADILYVFYALLAKWPHRDRIFVSPLGIVPEEAQPKYNRAAARKLMGLRQGDVAIINSGGVWRWTDFNTFLQAFCEVVEEGADNLKLFIMGLGQPNNIDHVSYQAETEGIFERFAHLIPSNLRIERDWDQAARNVKEFTSAADVGLNVSKDSLENWQSYRLRFLDYMYYGVPAINTEGDTLSNHDGRRAMFLVRNQDLAGYKGILHTISTDPILLETKRQAMQKLAKEFDSRRTYGSVIDQILATPRRPTQEIRELSPCVLDYANDRFRSLAWEKASEALKDFLFNRVMT
jgi:hypothetical protein